MKNCLVELIIKLPWLNAIERPKMPIMVQPMSILEARLTAGSDENMSRSSTTIITNSEASSW